MATFAISSAASAAASKSNSESGSYLGTKRSPGGKGYYAAGAGVGAALFRYPNKSTLSPSRYYGSRPIRYSLATSFGKGSSNGEGEGNGEATGLTSGPVNSANSRAPPN